MFDQVFRLSLPGKWHDAWLYMDAILAWDQENRLHRFPIDDIQKQVDGQVGPDLAPLFELALFRNEWKASNQFRRVAAMPSVNELIRKTIAEAFRERDATVELRLEFQELPVDAPPGTILDTEIYGNRVYVGTTRGAYETRYDPKRAGESRRIEELSEFRTSGLNAKYSALNVSNGDNGLWFKQLRFGPEGDIASMNGEDQLRPVAELSDSTAFASRNLLNYSGGTAPTLLKSRGRLGRPHSNARLDAYMVEGYEGAEPLDQLARSAFRGLQLSFDDLQRRTTAVAEVEIEVLGNAGRRLLVASGDLLKVLDMGWKNRTRTVVRPSPKFGTSTFHVPRDEILSTHQVGTNFAIEFFDSISMVTPSGVSRIYDGEVATIRTFNDSIRYKEVVLLVTEESLEVVGVL